MTRQEMFDRVWQHFVVDGRPLARAGDAAGNCYYRMPDGRRCALGVLISDEMYSPAFEGRPARALIEGSGPLAAILKDGLEGTPEQQSAFVQSLQYCHDEAGDTDDIRTNLERLAVNHGLQIPEAL
jgi:hypothetical protein